MNLTQAQMLERSKTSEANERLYEVMNEAKVKQFLLEHPRFIIDNPELLTHIELKYGEQETFSLVERQVKTLRDKNTELQGQQIDMLQTAHANEKLLILCNQFMLELVESSDLNSLASNIITRLKQMFELDDAALLLVGDYKVSSPVFLYDDAEKVKDLLNCQFPDNQPLCGRLGQSVKEALFGEDSYSYQSCALVPLGKGCEHGLIALASKDVSRFDPNMGTLFVELIANYICALVTPYERV